jgi:hypothetical protein
VVHTLAIYPEIYTSNGQQGVHHLHLSLSVQELTGGLFDRSNYLVVTSVAIAFLKALFNHQKRYLKHKMGRKCDHPKSFLPVNLVRPHIVFSSANGNEA